MSGGGLTDYERIGGAQGLERLIAAFIDRVFEDMVIGFHFIGRDRARIVQHEIEHAAGHLGGPSAYSGRPIAQVHRPLPINKGHFRRRIALLRTVLREHEVAEDIIERWLQADRRLEAAVVDGSDCAPDRS